MDEPRTPTPPADTYRFGVIDFRLIALLALLTLGLRTVQLWTTEVTARDSIGYIHIAWRLEHGDWRHVIPESPQHPGYPVAVLAASLPARLLFPNDLAYAMQLGAQLASAVASVLLTAPLFWLGAQLFNRRVGFWAVLLFQCLPCSGRIMADGLSESVFLLFAVTALAFAMNALRSRSVVGFAVAGAAGALAYLTRPEGLLIPACAAVTLLGTQVVARWRRPWRTVLAQLAALTCAVLVVGGPYMVLIGGLTKKSTASHIAETASSRAPAAEEISGGPTLFGVWWYGDPNDATGAKRLWALKTTAEVYAKAFFYVFWLPALVGLVWFRERFRVVPGAWMLLLLCAVLGALLYRVASVMGYLSDRHTILILLCGVLWATAALDAAARGLMGVLSRNRPRLGAPAWSAVLLGAVVLAPLAMTLQPLHGDRVGFRQAGHWLAGQAAPDDGVFDPFGWAGYYAGRYFRHGDAVNTDCSYVVLEEGGSHHTHLVTFPEAEKAAEKFDRKWEFTAPRGKDTARVIIYHLPEPWHTKPLPSRAPRRERGGMDLLLVTAGSAGDVHPFVGLGRVLRGRGHRVSVLTYPAFADLVRSAGLEYLCLPRPERPRDPGPVRPLGSFLKVIGRRWRKLARRSTALSHLRPVYEGVARHAIPGETVVAAHYALLGARVAHDHLGVPLVSVHLSPANLRSAVAPPIQPPLQFPRWAPAWSVRAAYRLLDAAVIDRVLGGPVNDFRRELGLPPVRRLYGGWKDSPQLVVGLFPEWYAPPPPDWPPQLRLTGFTLFDGLGDQTLPAAVRDFLDGDPPVVLTSSSETRTGRRLFAEGVAACVRLRRRGLVLTRFRDQVPDPLPDGFCWAEYAPFSRVLPRAAALVHQGGVGTAAQALAAGVPQLVVPLKNDQFDNAVRLERLGVARVLSRRDCTATVLARHLDYLLKTPDVAARCRDFAGRLAAADALGETCRLIEEMRPARMGAA